jgi:glucose-6-phosphate 1-dehydrogenase
MNEIKNSSDIIIFGAYGDLSFRKLIPALYHLCNDGYLEKECRIISVSRQKLSREEHIELTKEKLIEFIEKESFSEEGFDKFKELLHSVYVNFADNDSYKDLKELLDQSSNEDRVSYLSTSPSFFGDICKSLNHWNLIKPSSRVVLEKPIGRDLESAREINNEVLNYFKEDQIYRIDHYLGKNTVQNILALRFANRIIMPLWDATNIDHIQITVAESVGVEGRAGYYDQYGAMRDMIQNHLVQLLCLIAMEPPCSLDANSIRDEKVKVLRSLRPITRENIALNTVRAQYEKGSINGQPVPGYLEGEGVSESTTETFAALRIDIDNWRWNGVPFYIRSGKRMQKRNSEIVIQFKNVPHSIFQNNNEPISSNKLVIALQPEESITLSLINKVPELSKNMRLEEVELELVTEGTSKRKNEAYERLLLDVIRSNPTLFMRLDEVESAWKWVDTILEAWEDNLVPMKKYTAGTNGPSASIQLVAKDGRSWHEE